VPNAEDNAMRQISASTDISSPYRSSVPSWWNGPDTVCAASGDVSAQQLLGERLIRTESRFLLDNDMSIIPPLVRHLRDNLIRMNLCDEPGLLGVSGAVGEVLMQAIVRGNLEIDICLREADPQMFQTVIEKRRREKPYRNRRVHFVAKELLHEARYVIRHEGPGLYAVNALETDDARAFELVSARSMVLIHTL
jgi:hypothetical protein